MKNIKIILSLLFLFLLGIPVFAQTYYRPWQNYHPVKPQMPYKYIGASVELVQKTCVYNDNFYEPNEFFTDEKIDINSEETFKAFKKCCATHASRCVSHYIGSNNQTLLYTMVEKSAHKYMKWILTDGLVYETNVDEWGIYIKNGNVFVPVRNYNPMMLACIKGDLESAMILRENGAYLSKPENARKEYPFMFAKQHRENNPNFYNYIRTEYKEEVNNLNTGTTYGKTFSMNDDILKNFINSFEKNFIENQQKIIDKINEINKA